MRATHGSTTAKALRIGKLGAFEGAAGTSSTPARSVSEGPADPALASASGHAR